MSKRNFFTGARLLVFVMAMTLLAGCQNAPSAPQKSPDEVLKEAMAKLEEVKAYTFELAVKADLKNEADGSTKVDVMLKGSADVLNSQDPKVTFQLDGSFNDGASGSQASGKGELRLNKENVYFNVMNLNVEGLELPKEVTDLYNKWYLAPLPAELQQELLASAKTDAALTPEVLELKRAWEESKVLTNPQYVGGDTIMGEASHHYTVTVDKNALANFFKKIVEAQGQSVTAEEFAELKKGLDTADIKSDVWVSAQSGVMNQVTLNLDMKAGADTNGSSGKIDVRYSLGGIDKPITFQVPQGAQPFPMETLLNIVGGSSLMMDPSLVDPSLKIEAEGAADLNLEGDMIDL